LTGSLKSVEGYGGRLKEKPRCEASGEQSMLNAVTNKSVGAHTTQVSSPNSSSSACIQPEQRPALQLLAGKIILAMMLAI